MANDEYTVAGVMSGTSLDGLDIAICNFTKVQNVWSFTIDDAVTISYSEEWINKLALAHTLSSVELLRFHKHYGRFIGEKVCDFLKSTGNHIDFIASHGHTVFHDPSLGLTFQLGDGVEIAAITMTQRKA